MVAKENDERPTRNGGDVRPVPDPTKLTTEQLVREIAALREILETKATGSQDLFNMRVANVDKTTDRILVLLDRLPGYIDKEVGNLRTLHDEKFDGVEKQFKERDTRIDEGAKANQIKVDAAFAAAKEAVGEQNKSYKEATAKSEASFDKRMDQLSDTMKTSAGTSDAKIDDLKQRLTRVESNWTSIASVVAMFLAIAAIVVPLLTNHTNLTAPIYYQQSQQPQQPLYVPAPAGTQLPVTPPARAPQ